MDNTATIIVIDDHESVRDSTRALLEASGFDVRDFASAIDYLSSGAEGDCIVADMRMPNMSGLELQHELSRRRSAIPLIVVTGHGDVQLAVSAMRAGACDFLEKPVDDEQLIDSIRRALTDGRRARQSVQQRHEATELLANLTDRERQVLDRLVLGMSNKLVAYELGISPRTVETHRARLQTKLKARDLSHLVRLALAAGQLH